MFEKIKQQLKRFKNWIIGLIIGSAVIASGLTILPEQAINEQIDAEIKKIEAIINSDRQTNGKYKRQDKKNINGVDYEVHEYETSKGEIGYTIFITKEENNKIYKKAISNGIEKESRKFDWQLIQDNNVYETATST